jgi:NTE family protein
VSESSDIPQVKDGRVETRRARRHRPPRVALVLGGGGLKGFAHIGVIRALEEHGIIPAVLAGTSIGSLIAAAWARQMPVPEMIERARALRRRDLFRLNRMGMLLERAHAASIYLAGPLRQLCASVAPDSTFNELGRTLLVNTVDLQRGTQVVWGLPGLREVNVVDAIYASCALPGFFPPGGIDGRECVDGGVIDNLPVDIAGRGMDAVIAVDTGSSSLVTQKDIAAHGFPAVYMRAATTMMHALQLEPLERWAGPPMILIRPKVGHIGWFSFTHTDELIDAGYRAAVEALAHYESCLAAKTGIFPRRPVRLAVNQDKCIGCTLCVTLAPQLMALDRKGKAYSKKPLVQWSAADGDFVNHCPTLAIEATPLDADKENQPEGADQQQLRTAT